MFCTFCGNQLADDARFCTKCGAPVVEDNKENAIEAEILDASGDYEVIEDAEKSSRASSILTLGILSLAFSVSVFLPLVGIILGFVCKSKVSAFIGDYGDTEGKATVGKHLSTAGIIAGFALSVFLFLYVLIIVASILLSA